MAEIGVSEEACALRLLMKHGRRALRQFTSMRQVESWPDTSINMAVEYLLAKGAELVEEEGDPNNTLAWAQKRLADASAANQDLAPHGRLIALIQNNSSSRSGASNAQGVSPGSSKPAPGQWGFSPADDVRTVMQHVLRYGRDQQRRVVSYHPHCATAALAAAAGMGPQMRDVVHWMLAIGADVDGLDLRKLRKKGPKKKPSAAPAQPAQPAAADQEQQQPAAALDSPVSSPPPATQEPLTIPTPKTADSTMQPAPASDISPDQGGLPATGQHTANAPLANGTGPHPLQNGHCHTQVVKANGDSHPWHDSIQQSCVSDVDAYLKVPAGDSVEERLVEAKANAKQVLVDHFTNLYNTNSNSNGTEGQQPVEVHGNGHASQHDGVDAMLQHQQPHSNGNSTVGSQQGGVHSYDAVPHANGGDPAAGIRATAASQGDDVEGQGLQCDHHAAAPSEDALVCSNPFLQSQKHHHASHHKPHSHHAAPHGLSTASHHEPHQADGDAISANPFLTSQQHLASAHHHHHHHHSNNNHNHHQSAETAFSNPFLTTQQAAQHAPGMNGSGGEDGQAEGNRWMWEHGVDTDVDGDHEASWLDYLDEAAEGECDCDDEEGEQEEEEEAEEEELSPEQLAALEQTSLWVLSPLAEAAAAGDKYVVELLLEVHGANPVAHGNLADTAAYNAGHLHISKIVYEKALSQAAAARGLSPHCEDGVTGGGGVGPGGYTGSGAATYQYVTLGDWVRSVMPKWPSWRQLLYGSPAQQRWDARSMRVGGYGVGKGSGRAGASKRVLYAGLALAGTAALGYLLLRPASQEKQGQAESQEGAREGGGAGEGR